MGTLRRAEIWLLGDRNFPEQKVTVCDEYVADLPHLLTAYQRTQPALELDALVQAIWRFGLRTVRHNLERRVPIRLAGPIK